MILIIVLYAVLALTFIFAKYAVALAKPCFLIGFRMIVAGILLLGYQCFARRKELQIPRADLWLFAQTAIFHIYFAFVLEFWALQYVSALKTTMIYSSTPFISALLSYILLGERLSVLKRVGIAIGLGGLVPVFLVTAAQSVTATVDALNQGTGALAVMPDASWIGSFMIPEIVLMCAVVSAAYAWFLVKKLMQRGYGLIMINGVAMLLGGVLSMLTAAVMGDLANSVVNWQQFLLWVGLLILSANIIVYNLYGTLLRTYSLTFISFAGFLCPAFGALYEWLFFGGVLSWHYVASFLLVTLGLYVFYRQELKNT